MEKCHVVILICLGLAACRPAPATLAAASPTNSPTVRLTSTATPVRRTSTSRPSSTSTPTATPTEARTPLSPLNTPGQSSLAISRSNVGDLLELLHLGNGQVSDVDWPPSGGTVAVASGTGINFYDSESGTVLSMLGFKDALIRYHPDGERMAVALDSTIYLIRLDDGTVERTYQSAIPVDEDFHQSLDIHEFQSIYFSPLGKILLAESYSSSDFSGGGYALQAWDTETGESLYAVDAALIMNLAFSPSGNLIASIEGDGLMVRDAATGSRVFFAGGYRGVAFTPDGKNVLACTAAKGVVEIDPLSGEEVAQTGILGCGGFDLSADGSTLAIAYSGIQIWDLPSKTKLATIDSSPQFLELNFDGSRLSGWNESGNSVSIWDARRGESIQELRYTDTIKELAFPRGGSGGNPLTSLWSVDVNGDVVHWDIPGKQILHELSLPEYSTSGQDPVMLKMSPDGEMMAIADMLAKQWGIYRLSDGQEIASGKCVDGSRFGLRNMDFSPNAREFMFVCDNVLKVFDTTYWESSLSISDSGYQTALYQSDGTLMGWKLTEAAPYQMEEWDIRGQQLMLTFPLSASYSYGMSNVRWSAGNRYLAGDISGTIFVFDLANPARWVKLAGHSSPPSDGGGDSTVVDIAFHPFDYLLATSGLDRTIKLWDAQSGALLQSFDAGCGIVHSLAFSPDGRYLAAGCNNGTIRLYGIPS